MKQKVFAVYDSLARVFFPPFYVSHEAQARRSFMAIANDKESAISQHPQDFTLFEIGEFDDELGALIPHPKHINHGLASIYKVRELDHAAKPPESLGNATPVRASAQGGNSA